MNVVVDAIAATVLATALVGVGFELRRIDRRRQMVRARVDLVTLPHSASSVPAVSSFGVLARVDAVGTTVRRVRCLSPLSSRAAGWVVLLVPVATLAVGPSALVIGSLVIGLLRARAGSTQVAVRRHELDSLATLCDLVAVSVLAGLSLVDSLAAATSHAQRSSGGAVTTANDATVVLGGLLVAAPTLAVALDRWAHDASRERIGVAAVLRSAHTSGSGIADRLFERGTALRRTRRHETLESARKLPIRLLVPLVVCTLPAFVAVSVVPLLVVSLRSLGPALGPAL